MSTGQIILLAFVAIALLLVVAVFAIAYRRGDGGAQGRPDREALRRDRTASRPRDRRRAELDAQPEPAAVSTAVEEPPPVDPLETRPEISAEDYGVTRRQFFNRGILAVFGIFLLQFAGGALALMWPKLRAGGFGSKVNAGKVADIKAELTDAQGRVQPLFVSAAQSYVVPVTGDLSGSAFDGIPVVAGELMALWQKCVHLGCRVPTCDSSQGFECPCHGSKYNYHGEYESGPAPRNLDRFVVSVNEADELIIDTGAIIQTARATTRTTEYPKGPSCI
jgi:cytochrome b6-f complex iron-sulfur subunit